MKLSKILKGAALTGGVLLAAKGLDDRLEITHYSIGSEKIPSGFDGLKILQISDLHAQKVPGIISEVKGEAPDIIVLTGDFVHDTGSYAPSLSLAERLTKIAPVFSVTGNHDVRRTDFSDYRKALIKTGVKDIDNSSVTLKKSGAEITLSGISDPFSEHGGTIASNILNSARKIKKTDNYHIVLFHRANHAELLEDFGFDLILSGHMHGGQIRLAGGRGVCSPKSSWGSGTPMLFPKYFGGHYKIGDTDMIVNRGIGNPMIIPRLFNRPEITVIVLKSGKPVINC